MIDRRGSPRHRVFREAKVQFARGIYLSCQVRDMSRNGIRIRLSAAQALPQQINFEIASLELRQAARVSWQLGKEAGIVFTGEPHPKGCIPPASPPETW
jgi:PilZ domain